MLKVFTSVTVLRCCHGYHQHSLIQLFQRVLLGAESEVAVPVDIDSQWIPVSDQKPLADVKLGVVYQQRAL